MSSLLVNIATRNRPQLLLDTIARTLPNIRDPGTRVMVSIDDDDKATLDALALAQIQDLPRMMLSVKPREDTLGAKYNRMLDVPADVYLVMVDYAPHITPGFDAKILEAAAVYPDGYAVVYNHLANLSFPQINAMTAKLARAMGGFYPPHFPYWFVDHWLDDIAKIIDRIVFTDVWVDCSKRPGTMEMREPDFWATLFDATMVTRRRIAHDIIRGVDFDETPARKSAMLRNHPLFEERSVMVNNEVRNNAAGWTQNAPKADERYLRTRAAAVKVLQSVIPELEADQATRDINQPKAVAA